MHGNAWKVLQDGYTSVRMRIKSSSANETNAAKMLAGER